MALRLLETELQLDDARCWGWGLAVVRQEGNKASADLLGRDELHLNFLERKTRNPLVFGNIA